MDREVEEKVLGVRKGGKEGGIERVGCNHQDYRATGSSMGKHREQRGGGGLLAVCRLLSVWEDEGFTLFVL